MNHLWSGLGIVILVGVYVAWCLLRPMPKLSATILTLPKSTAPAAKLAWPADGQAAVGILGSPILETHAPQANLPTASTAKLITVLTVLQHKPLALNQPGPMITLTNADVNLYKSYVAKGGSTVPVTAGEQISQYQMLQTILLPSANNMADSLAIWAFGSLQNYATAANDYLAKHGVTNTIIGSDASGFSPSTTSTAQDLVRLGELAMQNPVLSQIVAQPTAASIPVANTIKNVNWLLGTSGIIGVKTGNTDQAGGVYVAASRITVNHQPLTIVTAQLGAPTLAIALKQSLQLMQSAQANFPIVPVVKKHQTAGSYHEKWQNRDITAATNSALNLQLWNGSAYTASTSLKSVNKLMTSGA